MQGNRTRRVSNENKKMMDKASAQRWQPSEKKKRREPAKVSSGRWVPVRLY